MIFCSSLIRTYCKALTLSFSLMSLAFSASAIDSDINQVSKKASERLAAKFYQRALYYYFQQQPELALRQLSYNKARLAMVDNNALLFEAGLQVSLGLNQEAEGNLNKMISRLEQTPVDQTDSDLIENTDNHRLAQQNLLLVALLQLADQQLAQGAQQAAQQSLAKISQVPKSYYHQYYTLSQLAYWPNTPKVVALSTEFADGVQQAQSNSAYILINQALADLELKRYPEAEVKLKQVKSLTWYTPELSFWQQLFSQPEAEQGFKLNQKLESQSLQDYASLLLAQLYVEQQQFEFAYQELSGFPQTSPYQQQAMFLFALASLKTAHYQEAKAIFQLLKKQSPNSYLGWQAGLLLAQQYSKQNQLDSALSQYLAIETDYQNQLASLASFQQQLIELSDNSKSVSYLQLINSKNHSIWLEQALASSVPTYLNQQLKQLDEVAKSISQQQEQVAWLQQAIKLNEQRQASISQRQQEYNFPQQINELENAQQQVAEKLKQALKANNAKVFANKQETTWLQRINTSQQVINSMEQSPAYQAKAKRYQQRLKRVKGVLAWQLGQQFPQRYWQHKSLLAKLEQALISVKKQMLVVNSIQERQVSSSEQLMTQPKSNLVRLKQRQQLLSQHNQELNQEAKQLTANLASSLLDELQGFALAQQQSLNYYLHHTRRSMAKVLEQLKQSNTESASQPNKQSVEVKPSALTGEQS